MAYAFYKILGIGPKQQPEAEETITKKRRNDSETQQSEAGKEEIYSGPSPTIPVETQKPRLSPKPKKQRLDSPEESPYANIIVEHTPKKITLGLDYVDENNKEFPLESSSVSDIEFSDLDSLSELDTSLEKDKIPMCRKLSKEEKEAIVPEINSTIDNEFIDLEDHNEEQRLSLLESYQCKIEKIDKVLKKLLTEFQFHIEVSDVFKNKSHTTMLQDSVMSKSIKFSNPKVVSGVVSPTGSWNVVLEQDDAQNKMKIREQLLSMKELIENFSDTYLGSNDIMGAAKINSTMTESSKKKNANKNIHNRKIRVNRNKCYKKIYDFPDLKETLHNLFSLETDRNKSLNTSISTNNLTLLISEVDENTTKCTCQCREHRSTDSVKSTDSGIPTKREDKSDSITSSIGDFTLDNSQLTTYSESLEQVLSYNSFNDSNLISRMLKKSAIERITFYVKVHNIEMTTGDVKYKKFNQKRRRVPSISEREYDFIDFQEETNEEIYIVDKADSLPDENAEELNANDVQSIIFACKACVFDTTDERGLYAHIIEPNHCEKLHFLYKIAYIRKCFSTGEEIQPSTILNPMTMYRDDNKIVCFGESKFACSLCFEQRIVGEFVLMAHCHNPDHVEKRNWLREFLDEPENNAITEKDY